MIQTKLFSGQDAFPPPDKGSMIYSKKLTAYLKQLIKNHGGEIGLDKFMSAVLYEPGLGYYSTGLCKFGADGDFITAPEISPIFSYCLARQCAEVLVDISEPIILELGAGSGKMAKDIITELSRLDCLPEQYWILEVSADLKRRQQNLLKKELPSFYARFIWLDELPKEPFSGLILANEVLDALPVKRFKKSANTFKEMKIGLIKDQFNWVESDFDFEELKLLENLENNLPDVFPEQYVSEYNFNLASWLPSLTSCFKKGLLLFIDYGYTEKDFYHYERCKGTLLCHYRHLAHDDIFSYIGLQDITSSVNFTALADIAYKAGLNVDGYTTQAYFLAACDLNEFILGNETIDIKEQLKITQQIHMLTMPDNMGEKFKVMALTRDFNKALKGFSIIDQSSRL